LFEALLVDDEDEDDEDDEADEEGTGGAEDVVVARVY
jgi:hypothetical protein